MNNRRYLRDDRMKIEDLVEWLSIISDNVDDESRYLKQYVSGNAMAPDSLLLDIIDALTDDIKSLKEIKYKLQNLD